MSKKISVTLIVINYNGRKLLNDYFISVFKQTHVPDEILLIDNASTDGSISFVKKSFPIVQIIRNPQNSGTAGGANFAAQFAKGKYIIFQNNDVRLDKNCIKELVKVLKKDPKIGIGTSISLFMNKKGKIIENAGGDMDIFGFNWPIANSLHLSSFNKLQEVFLTYGNSFIIRKSLFQKIGGFDKRFFTLNDDVDLSWRVRLLNYKIVACRSSFVYHIGHATLGPLFPRAYKRYLSERNCLGTLLKNYSYFSLVKYLPIYFVLIMGEAMYYVWRGRLDLTKAIMKAVGWNLLNLPNTLTQRFFIQQKRKVNENVILNMLKHTSYKLAYFKNFKDSL